MITIYECFGYILPIKGRSGPTAIEAMNWVYKDLLAEKFLLEAFDKAKRLEALRI
jgi:L-ribulose-5-phosphate 3-epimerase